MTKLKLKQMNSGAEIKLPHGWTPDTRFIKYEYGRLPEHGQSLPQDPSQQSGKPLDLRAFKLKK